MSYTYIGKRRCRLLRRISSLHSRLQSLGYPLRSIPIIPLTPPITMAAPLTPQRKSTFRSCVSEGQYGGHPLRSASQVYQAVEVRPRPLPLRTRILHPWLGLFLVNLIGKALPHPSTKSTQHLYNPPLLFRAHRVLSQSHMHVRLSSIRSAQKRRRTVAVTDYRYKTSVRIWHEVVWHTYEWNSLAF